MDNATNYYGILIMHYYDVDGNFTATRAFDITEDNYILKDFGEPGTTYSVRLSDTNEQVTIVEETSNIHYKRDQNRDNMKNIVKKRIEDIGNLASDINKAIRNVPDDGEIDWTLISSLFDLIKYHKKEINKFIATNGESKVYVTEKIKEYTINHGVETPLHLNVMVTWYKRNIGSRPAKVVSWEKVEQKTIQFHDPYFMTHIKDSFERVSNSNLQ